jgi:hypothetical protein
MGMEFEFSISTLCLFVSLFITYECLIFYLFIMFIWGIEIDLSVGRPGEQSVHRVFVDPGGSHCIAVVVGSGGADTFYTHAKWTKPRVLSKLRGLVVNAVAWNRQQITEGNLSSLRPWVVC